MGKWKLGWKEEPKVRYTVEAETREQCDYEGERHQNDQFLALSDQDHDGSRANTGNTEEDQVLGAVLMNLVLDILKFCASQEPIYMSTSMNTFLATSNKNP